MNFDLKGACLFLMKNVASNMLFTKIVLISTEYFFT